jgi:WW domain-containing oxidoreductase
MLFIKELVKHLPPLDSPNPILALSVHPGAVATEQQKGATQAYGIVGKLLEGAASLGFMDPSQGAESASWAGTSPNVGERREEVQGQYFTEADGKVGTESEQGKSEQLAKNLWNLSVKTLKEKVNYDVKM